MNKHEFSALPPDLQRDVRLAVALGWPLESIRNDFEYICVKEDRIRSFPWRIWRPTKDREIWAALLEVFPIAVVPHPDYFPTQKYEVYFVDGVAATWRNHLPTAIVCEVIRRDPLGHLSRSGL